MKRKWLAALAIVGTLFAAAPAGAAPIVEDHWVDAGKTKVVPIVLEGGSTRLLIVEGDGTLVEYCLIDPNGQVVHCGRGYLQIEVPVPDGLTEYELRVENVGLIPGNFRVIAI